MSSLNNHINPFLESLHINLIKIKQNVNYRNTTNQEGFSELELSNNFTVEKQEHTKLYHTPYDDKLLFSTSYKSRDLLLYILLNIKKDLDYIELNHPVVCKKTRLSKNSYYSAVKELTEIGIICRKQKGEYWINPKFIFNGNRKQFFLDNKPDNVKVVHELPGTSITL